MSLNPAGIPQELKDRQQWICWRYEGNGLKRTKVPYIAALRDGELTYRASSRNPKHWNSFDKALKVYKNSDASGIGYVFSEDDPYAVADFDDALKDGAVDPKVQNWLEELDTYTEVSVSGSGFHVICEADVGAGASVAGYEVYDRGRYIAMTGDVWEGRSAVERRPNAFRRLSEIVRERQRRQEGRKGLERRRDAHRPFEGDGDSLDIEDFLYENHVSILREVGDAGGRKFQILCPWLNEHTGGDESGTYAGQFDDGALWFDCKHSHCQHRKWQEFRVATEADDGLAEWSRDFRKRYNIRVGSKGTPKKMERSAGSGSAAAEPEPAEKPIEVPEDKPQDLVSEFIEHGRFAVHDAIVNGIDPPEELLPDILLAGKAHTIFAPGGAGKTWVLVWIATELVRRGKRVLIFDLENSGRTISERFEEMGIDPMRAAEDLWYFDFPNLHPEVYAGALEVIRPDIVMFDSWVGFLSGAGLNENEATDIAAWANDYVKPALRMNCATLMLDHVPHEDDDRERGSTRKRDEVDVRWKLSKIGEFDRENTATINLWLKKDREGWLPTKLGFELGGDPLTSQFTMRRNDDLARIEISHPTPRERLALKALERFGEGGTSTAVWLEEIKKISNDIAHKQSLHKVRRALVKKGKVVEVSGGYAAKSVLDVGGVSGVSGVYPDTEGIPQNHGARGGVSGVSLPKGREYTPRYTPPHGCPVQNPEGVSSENEQTSDTPKTQDDSRSQRRYF